eukprot:TRINITY_DN5414_c0_g1_i1.p1 TRINITY_DN5414_c0_g1~~TRINITY_DN5414_c0_g1_i1.p1  ORF type:complete len:177 (+),score=0.60 TRINITY_DN5414_c0_g1_i1:143-673(+)
MTIASSAFREVSEALAFGLLVDRGFEFATASVDSGWMTVTSAFFAFSFFSFDFASVDVFFSPFLLSFDLPFSSSFPFDSSVGPFEDFSFEFFFSAFFPFSLLPPAVSFSSLVCTFAFTSAATTGISFVVTGVGSTFLSFPTTIICSSFPFFRFSGPFSGDELLFAPLRFSKRLYTD